MSVCCSGLLFIKQRAVYTTYCGRANTKKNCHRPQNSDCQRAMTPQSAARWWRLSGVRCAWNRPTYGKAPPYRGQVQGLTWQGETEPGARAEWQGGMRMQTRARADCPRALRIESALRLRHGENQHYYATTAQNPLETRHPSFWQTYPHRPQKAAVRSLENRKNSFCNMSA